MRNFCLSAAAVAVFLGSSLSTAAPIYVTDVSITCTSPLVCDPVPDNSVPADVSVTATASRTASVSGGGSGFGTGRATAEAGKLKAFAESQTQGNGEGFMGNINFLTYTQASFDLDDLEVAYIGNGTPPASTSGRINLVIDTDLFGSASAASPDGTMNIQTDSIFNLQVQTLAGATGGDFGELRLRRRRTIIGGDVQSPVTIETEEGMLIGYLDKALIGESFEISVELPFIQVGQSMRIRVILDTDATVAGQYSGVFSGLGRATTDAFNTVEFALLAFEIDDPDVVVNSASANIVNNIFLNATPAVGDLTGVTSIDFDAIPDFAYVNPEISPHDVVYFSGDDGTQVLQRAFLDANHELIAISTVFDADADGVSDDPAVAALGYRASDDSYRVQVRRADNGARIGDNIRFHANPDWDAIDVAVLNDTDGDGVFDDPSLAVLAINPAGQVGRVELRRLSDGSLVKRLNNFFDQDWRPIAVEALTRSGSPEITVLGTNRVNGRNRTQTKRVSDGGKEPNINFLGSVWVAQDLAALRDSDGNGVADDPAWLVLGINRLSGRNRVQSKLISTRALLKSINFVNENWAASSLTESLDIGGNQIEDIGAVTLNRASGNVIIKVRDYDTEAVTLNINP